MNAMTTDDLLAMIPQDEDRNWEFKSAAILLDKSKLKQELSKQVSAFANSGGGYILIGFNEDTKDFEPCAELQGRQSMKDYLSTLVETSVAFEIQAYSVDRIPMSNSPGVVTLQAFGRPMPGMDPRTATRMMWEQLGFTFCPVSQNAVGREYHFGWRDNVAESIRQGQRLEREFK